jgi:hypothetical protein
VICYTQFKKKIKKKNQTNKNLLNHDDFILKKNRVCACLLFIIFELFERLRQETKITCMQRMPAEERGGALLMFQTGCSSWETRLLN